MNIQEEKNRIIVTGLGRFDLDQTFDCGQCFRFEKKDGCWQGVAMGKVLNVSQTGDKLIFHNTTPDDFHHIWRKYFDLDRDYDLIIKAISKDSTLKQACEFAGGIKILRQESFEVICSFIISQNNNIPRIKGIISRLCENFGERIFENNFAFPSAKTLADLSEGDLSVLRAGFRVKYIKDASKRIAGGEIDIKGVADMPLEDARKELKKIYGVGDKVANCILLFGYSRIDALPIDVWIKRSIDEFFPDGFPECCLPYAGIAQQYLFHYARINRAELFKKKK